MARSKTFNPDKILDQAIELLWHQGYEKTSIQDLVDHLGIGRGSLYDTYGGKHTLYLAALQRYQAQSHQNFSQTLQQEESVIEAIHHIFNRVIEESLADPHTRGCFLTNATAELAPHDPQVAQQVAINRDFITEAFRQAIVRGQQNNEIPNHYKPAALASYLFNALQGLRVIAKTNPSRQTLTDIVTITLAALQ